MRHFGGVAGGLWMGMGIWVHQMGGVMRGNIPYVFSFLFFSFLV